MMGRPQRPSWCPAFRSLCCVLAVVVAVSVATRLQCSSVGGRRHHVQYASPRALVPDRISSLILVFSRILVSTTAILRG